MFDNMDRKMAKRLIIGLVVSILAMIGVLTAFILIRKMPIWLAILCFLTFIMTLFISIGQRFKDTGGQEPPAENQS